MNTFIGIGTIADFKCTGKVLKFTFSVQQDKLCLIPCLIYDPDDRIKRLVENLQSLKEPVWLQGRIASNEFTNNGTTHRNLVIVTYPKLIKAIS